MRAGRCCGRVRDLQNGSWVPGETSPLRPRSGGKGLTRRSRPLGWNGQGWPPQACYPASPVGAGIVTFLGYSLRIAMGVTPVKSPVCAELQPGEGRRQLAAWGGGRGVERSPAAYLGGHEAVGGGSTINPGFGRCRYDGV